MGTADFPESQSRTQAGIRPFCELPDDNLQGLVKLLAWISDSVLPLPGLLAEIWIVPEGQMIAFINRVIAQYSPGANPYRAGEHELLGAAIPFETESGTAALILLDERPLRQLSADNPFVPEVISTLLEELLHVDLYSKRWGRESPLKFRPEEFGCSAALYTLCASFHDEYVVCRRKNQLLAENLCFQNDEGVATPAHVSYGMPLKSALNNAAVNLRQLVRDGAAGTLTIADTWEEILAQTYRGIFEPLARSAGFVAGNPSGEHPHNNAGESVFYTDHVASFWKPMEVQLDRSVMSDFVEEPDVIRQLVNLYESFLSYIGISVRELEDGTCWVEFNKAFFDGLDI